MNEQLINFGKVTSIIFQGYSQKEKKRWNQDLNLKIQPNLNNLNNTCKAKIGNLILCSLWSEKKFLLA